MPLDFNPIGINITLPADGALVVPYTQDGPGNARLQELRNRIHMLDPATPQYSNMLHLNADRAVPNTPAQPSYITINGLRYDVVGYIGGGNYGSIYLVRTVGDAQIPAGDYIMKLQIINNGNDYLNNTHEVETINEALINYILCTRFPDRCNVILKCVAMLFGGRLCYCFILERLIQNLGEYINQLGITPGERPAGTPPTVLDTNQGNALTPALCSIATGLEQIFDTFNGNHGDLKADNIMDGKLIDYGFFRLVYEGVTLSAEPVFNTRPSMSRDLTNLIYYIWHYYGGHRCSIRDTLQNFLNIPNPDLAVFAVFTPWSLRGVLPQAQGAIGPINRIRIKAAADAPRQAMRLRHPIDLGPMYRYFNYYDAVATFVDVKQRYCPPGPAPMVLDGGLRKKSRRTRRNVRVRKSKNTNKPRINKTNKHRKL